MESANNLRSLREERGLSRVKLSREFDVDPMTILRWESGERPIRDEDKFRLAKFFGVSVLELMGWEHDPAVVGS